MQSLALKNATVSLVLLIPILLMLLGLGATLQRYNAPRPSSEDPPNPVEPINPPAKEPGGIDEAGTNPGKEPIPEIPPHDQPPIIMLSEAEGYSFETGKAAISQEFGIALNTKIIPVLKEISHKYECDLIEVIGHTDGQPVSSMRSNLDANLARSINGEVLTLTPGSNADLGLMRAWSVIRYLQEAGGLQEMTFYGYSAGQLIRLDGGYAVPRDVAGDASRRRIEIRLRRSLISAKR